MSISQSKEKDQLSDSFYDPNEEPQDEEMLLDTTQQKKNSQIQTQSKVDPQNLSSKPSSFSFKPYQTQSLPKNQNHDLYVKKEHSRINGDLQDYNDLETQIQRLKKIKNEYKEQKQSIQKLSKAVQTLKSQNRSLKLQKQSNREDSVNKNHLNEVPQNFQTSQKHPGKRILNQNIMKGNLFNRNQNAKNINLSHEGLYLSPQSHRRISSNSLRNLQANHLNNEENYVNDMIRIDQEIMIKNHQSNKKSVIANFVEQLKYQLQQNQVILQRQKMAHRDTKQKLQACIEELSHLRSLINRQKNGDFLERENIQLRKQLEMETEQRLLAEERLREKQLILRQYESDFMTRGSQLDRQFDKMDEIYFSIERTLKL